MTDSHDPGRREFLRNMGRAAILGAIALGSAALLARNGACTQNGACNGCGALRECNLPEAVAYRLSDREYRGPAHGKP